MLAGFCRCCCFAGTCNVPILTFRISSCHLSLKWTFLSVNCHSVINQVRTKASWQMQLIHGPVHWAQTAEYCCREPEIVQTTKFIESKLFLQLAMMRKLT